MRLPHDSIPDANAARRTAQPSTRGAEALHQLIRRHAEEGSAHVSDASWRLAARLMSDDARARGVLVEELLVGVKRTWPALAERESISRVESAHLLSRFVTLCVEEYYGPLG
jgi:hypothetical protein